MPALGLALVASLILTAAGAASASAATQHWYVGGTKLAEGVSKSVTMKGTTNFTLGWDYAEAHLEFKCTSQNAEGEIQNPAGGGAGTTNYISFNLGGCTRVKPLGSKGCQIPGGHLSLGTHGLAAEFGSKPAVKFEPQGGGNFTEFWMEGEVCGFRYTALSGSFSGIANSATSSLEFTKASSAIMVNTAYPATLVGTSKLETTSGQTVTVAS